MIAQGRERTKSAGRFCAAADLFRCPLRLVTHREFLRDRKGYGGPGKWMTAAVQFAERQAAKPVPRDRLWLVVQGYDLPEQEATEVRRAAAKIGAGTIFVARSRIDQSFEPRITQTKP